MAIQDTGGLRRATLRIPEEAKCGFHAGATYEFEERFQWLLGQAGLSDSYTVRPAGKRRRTPKDIAGVSIGAASPFMVEVSYVPERETVRYIWHLVLGFRHTEAVRDRLERALRGEQLDIINDNDDENTVVESPAASEGDNRTGEVATALQNHEALCLSLLTLWSLTDDKQTELRPQEFTPFIAHYYGLEIRQVGAFYAIVTRKGLMERSGVQGIATEYSLSAGGLAFLTENRELLKDCPRVASVLERLEGPIAFLEAKDLQQKLKGAEELLACDGTALKKMQHRDLLWLRTRIKGLKAELAELDRLRANLEKIKTFLAH